jgi:outer membrane receptor protein involved in Fe transport
LKVENTQFETNGRFLEVINPVGVSYGDLLTGLTGGTYQLDTEQDFKRQSNGDFDETEVDNITLTVDYAMGDFTLTSITGSVEYDYFQQCDCDFTGVNVFQTSGNEAYEQFSQELRLTSPTGETLEYIVGAYYSEYDIDNDELLGFDSNSAAGPAGVSTILNTGNTRLYTSESEQWSVFGQVTWNISETVRLTLGGRYSDEDKEGTRSVNVVSLEGDQGPFDRTIYPNGDATDPAILAAAATYAGAFGIDTVQLAGHDLSGKRSESKFTPAVNMQWDATDEAMVYASYTEGFKAGGFDARSNSNQVFEFDEELATSYEIGTKMSLDDGAAELNIAAYYTSYEDLQVSQFDGRLGFDVSNAGEATIYGIEIDGRWQLTDALYLSGAVGVLDFEFDEFAGSACNFSEKLAGAVGTCDRKGETREFAPELTANLGAAYYIDVSDNVDLTLGLDLSYSDDYFTAANLDPSTVQDSYVKVNARVALESSDAIWSVALLAENLTDEEISTFGGDVPLAGTLTGNTGNASYAFYEAPRNVAVKVRYNF